MDRKNVLLENENWTVYMAGFFDGVTGYRYIHFVTKNKKIGKTYKTFRVPLDKIVENKANYREFIRYGLEMNELRTIKQETRKKIKQLVYDEDSDLKLTFEEIREEFLEKVEATEETQRETWYISKGRKKYYNVPTAQFKQLFEEGSFCGWTYREFVNELKIRGYLLCSKGRNDYKHEKNGIRGICMMIGSELPEESKRLEKEAV